MDLVSFDGVRWFWGLTRDFWPVFEEKFVSDGGERGWVKLRVYLRCNSNGKCKENGKSRCGSSSLRSELQTKDNGNDRGVEAG
jgi:hypothetical protein